MSGFQILAACLAFVGVFGGSIFIARVEALRDEEESEGLESAPRNGMERFALRMLSVRILARLQRAGFRSVADRSIFAMVRLSLVVLFVAIFASFALMKGTTSVALLMGVLGGFLGWWAPGFWLDLKGKARQDRIGMDLPLMFDLLVTCIHGGMGLDSAWNVIRKQMARVCPPLAEEMKLAEFEIGIGVPRDMALRNIADRSGVVGFSNVAAMLSQSERFGSGLAETFRAHAEGTRNEQWQAMEESAHVASIKIIFPLTVFLFPALILLIIGPMLTFTVRALENIW